MPRGRPRKNPALNIEKNTAPTSEKNISCENKKQNVPDEYSFLSQSKYDNLFSCDRCHSKILSGEKIINLTYLTGMAPWHRESAIDKVCLCNDCAKSLNTIIDNFLLNNNNGVKRKYTQN